MKPPVPYLLRLGEMRSSQRQVVKSNCKQAEPILFRLFQRLSGAVLHLSVLPLAQQ